MTDLLRNRPWTTPAMLEIFDDRATLAHALAFEATLARAEAEAGLIPHAAAQAIKACCDSIEIDPVELADAAAMAGTLAIPLVARLRAALPAEIAKHLHLGATSQDIADTVLVCQAKAATAVLLTDLERIGAALRPLAEQYASTPAIGRTLLQDALPIGFGLRIAQWFAGIDNAAFRLASETIENLKIQLGGAVGTRAGLGGQGAAVAAHMASAFGLAPGVPWHSRRVGLVAIGAALGIVIGALGKMARDVSLLAQNAVGEAREPLLPGRGGSSAMAHKRNPTGCQVALSASLRAPGLIATLLAGLPQEEERGLGGWQAEGPVLVELFLLAAGAAQAVASVAEGLEIDAAAIKRNLAASRTGEDIGESAAIVKAILAHHRGRN